jgi:cardiolipin synthase
MTFLGAIACAKKSIRIATPYFLPDSDLLSALNVASLRGVKVDIVVPQQSNLRLVHWAMRGIHGQVLEYGCNLWLSPAPFDHAKLFVVDDHWCLIGSANWDSRSLRLNFEFDVECHGGSVANQSSVIATGVGWPRIAWQVAGRVS